MELDRFKEPADREPAVACRCGQCDEEIQAGAEVLYDHRADLSFCERNCFRDYLVANIKDEVDEFIDLLENEGNIWNKEAR